MLRSFLSAADRGETVWLGDVREAFRNLTDDRRIVLRLTAFDGKVRDWEYRLPVWRSKQEAAFIQEYLCACVFNMLSCFGGRELRFFLPSGDSSLEEMTAGLSRVFQVQEKNRSGYGKVISISNRLSRAFGGGAVRFVLDSLDQYRPLPENLQADETDLGSKLKGLVRIAGLGLRCGIDVGGTDIKAAVCCDGVLVAVHELDWNPASYDTADKIILPILRLVCLMSEEASGRVSYPGKLNLELLETHVPDNTFSGITRKYDSIGLSFPDVVIGNRILGGETPKTHGLRNNPDLDYETEFAHVSKLKERLQSLCVPQGRVRIANDGNVAAFIAAVEMACQGLDLREGVFAHSLGTDLGTGWLTGQGKSLPCLWRCTILCWISAVIHSDSFERKMCAAFGTRIQVYRMPVSILGSRRLFGWRTKTIPNCSMNILFRMGIFLLCKSILRINAKCVWSNSCRRPNREMKKPAMFSAGSDRILVKSAVRSSGCFTRGSENDIFMGAS